ncbi:MAG: amino acid ABC transporter permease [Oscillospiraceae bacterium]|nr:amino acid ABC transporter permease [Oscillospiraceae bacterium]
MSDLWQSFSSQFNTAFVAQDRWRFITQGIGNTLILTFFALILGIVLGVVVAAVRSSWDKVGPTMKKGPLKYLFQVANGVCKVYLTVIRGTPVMVQILIIFFVIMATSTNKMLCGIIAFGINSGAYVAEIIRGGIMSVDAGQSEAGRSLGFNYIQTMRFIVLPQALKNILPSLANEFIVLLKETAIAGYVGVTDLTRGANIIRGVTYQALFPLVAVALIYLVFVMFITWLVGKLERRLRASER